MGARTFSFPRKTAGMALKAKEEKTREKIPFLGCYLSTTIPLRNSENKLRELLV